MSCPGAKGIRKILRRGYWEDPADLRAFGWKIYWGPLS